jgi:YihY family inner membrane protein
MSSSNARSEDEDTQRQETESTSGPLPGPLAKLDQFQQNHAFAAVPIAVYKKFSDDEAGKLAALISYFAFLSVFPLLILLATILSRVLVDYPDLADKIVATAAGSFLSIGATGTVQPLQVSGFALALAVVVSLWGGLAVANAMQDAMNTVYEVPKTWRAGFVWRVLRSASLLVIVGVGLPVMTVLQGIAGRTVTGVIASIVILIIMVILNTGLIALSFRRSTVADTTWRGVLPGAAIAAIAWSVMQGLGTSLLTQRVAGTQSSYGQFALVIGLLLWFFVLAQVTIYCAELNMVLAYRLWPRGLKSVVQAKADTNADVRAYSHYPKREQQATNMQVSVDVVDDGNGDQHNESKM